MGGREQATWTEDFDSGRWWVILREVVGTQTEAKNVGIFLSMVEDEQRIENTFLVLLNIAIEKRSLGKLKSNQMI